jgi:hypothetical protein
MASRIPSARLRNARGLQAGGTPRRSRASRAPDASRPETPVQQGTTVTDGIIEGTDRPNHLARHRPGQFGRIGTLKTPPTYVASDEGWLRQGCIPRSDNIYVAQADQPIRAGRHPCLPLDLNLTEVPIVPDLSQVFNKSIPMLHENHTGELTLFPARCRPHRTQSF